MVISSDRVANLNYGAAIKLPVTAATTAAITLAGAQTIDGVAVTLGDRVLVKDQSSSSANGIYDVTLGAWQRSVDFDGQNDIVQGSMVYVNDGATNGGRLYQLETEDPAIGSALTFEVVGSTPSFDVVAAGAVGDGTTDDTAAFQAAINAAVLVNGKVFLPIPPSKYMVGALTIGAAGSYNTCSIVGETVDFHFGSTASRAVVIELITGTNDTMFTIPASDASDVGPGPVLFQDVWLKGNRSNQTGTSYAINCVSHTLTSNKQRSAFFKRVRIEEFRSGGVRAGTLRNAGVMEQTVILNIGNAATGSAIVLGSCQDWRFIACDFGVTLGPVVQDSGAEIVSYTQCNFFNGGTHGYKADTAAGDHYFVNCSFDRNNRNGVNIGTTSPDHWSFVNCRFTINSQETTNTYFDVSLTDNPTVEFIGCLFSKGGGSITKFPAYHFDFNGVTTKGISVVGCTFEATASVSGIVSDVSNLAMFGQGTYNSFRVIYDASDVNHVRVEGGNTGQGPALYVAGDDTNIAMDLRSKGTSSIRCYTQNGSALQFVVANVTSASSYIQAAGSTTDQPAVSAQGSGSNIDLLLSPKGTGNVRYGTWTSNADAAVNGYVTIKDSAGNARKLATIA